MSDADYDLDVPGEAFPREDAPPEFGLVDLIEAFTAMRHEWRGHTKESRAAAESVRAAVNTIQELESALQAQIAANSTSESKQLVEAIVDTDHHLTRAIVACGQVEASRSQRAQSDVEAIQQYFDGMSSLARWFARPLLTFVLAQERNHAPVEGVASPTLEGLNLVLARLRRAMKELQIERLDARGQPFDANVMNAIGAVESAEVPSGYVVEQLAPGYRWRGQLLRYADVRVCS
jgi:molecular chaperone GrpE